MIRPITLICWVLALSAGLYLYRAKHDVELMDKHIDQIARETNDIRAQSRHLLDDWLRLGEPEQLHKYSDEYLGLKTIAPTQFARLSDLASRLPAPRADPVPDPAPAGDQGEVVARASDDTATDMAGVDPDELPVPPIPPTLISVSLPGVTAIPLQARPVTPRTDAAQADPKPRATEEPRIAAPRPIPLAEPREVASSRPVMGQAGSGAALPLQAQPMPVQPAQSPPTQTAASQNQPAQPPRPHDMPPLPAAGAGVRQAGNLGLPPLQAQGNGPARVFGQPPQRLNEPHPMEARSIESRPMEARPLESRPAETRPVETAYDPRREVRPAAAPYAPAPAYQQPPAYAAQDPRMIRQAAPQAGSLLGTSRGPVPLPLPAPTPVSASWAGQSGQGR